MLNENVSDEMDIFVDEDETFPITIHYRGVMDGDGNRVRVEVSTGEVEGDGWKTLRGEFSQPSSQAFGEVLEQATIINHMDFRPLLRTWALRDGVLVRFMKSWNVRTGHFDEAGNPILAQISQRAISGLHYELSQTLFIEYMNRTGLSTELKAALRDEQVLRMRAREQVMGNSDVPIPDFSEGMRGGMLPEDMGIASELAPVPDGFPTISMPRMDSAGM